MYCSAIWISFFFYEQTFFSPHIFHGFYIILFVFFSVVLLFMTFRKRVAILAFMKDKKKKKSETRNEWRNKKVVFFLIRRKKKKRRWKNFPLFLSGKITIFSIIFFSQHFSLHIILSPTFYLSLSLSISDRIYHRLWASSCLIFVCMQHISTRFDRNVTSYFE